MYRVVRKGVDEIDIEVKFVKLSTAETEEIFHPRIAYIKKSLSVNDILEENVAVTWEKKIGGVYTVETFTIHTITMGFNLISIHTKNEQSFPSIAASENYIMLAINKEQKKILYQVYNFPNLQITHENTQDLSIGSPNFSTNLYLLEVKRQGEYFGLICSSESGETFFLSFDTTTNQTYYSLVDNAFETDFDIDENDGTLILFYAFYNNEKTAMKLGIEYFKKQSPSSYSSFYQNYFEERNEFSWLNFNLVTTGSMIYLWTQTIDAKKTTTGQLSFYFCSEEISLSWDSAKNKCVCAKGYYNDTNKFSCILCEENTYKETIGDGQQSDGHISHGTSNKQCECLKGFYYSEIDNYCSPCEINTYKNSVGNYEMCKDCQTGFISEEGSANCTKATTNDPTFMILFILLEDF